MQNADHVGTEDEPLRQHYAQGLERDRLDSPLGVVELERTREILGRHLPPPPAAVADVGGGPGRYALWLAGKGYRVALRDLIPSHIDQALEQAGALGVHVDAEVGDARSLDLADGSMDVVLLLGPLYHLARKADRVTALREARRVLRPGGVLFAAAISRWAPRLHGLVAERLYREFPQMLDVVAHVERTGELPPLNPGSFVGYCHRPGELRAEVRAAGLDVVDLVAVEGIAFAFRDLDQRIADPQDRAVILEAARALERIPELLGLGPHLVVTARREVD